MCQVKQGPARTEDNIVQLQFNEKTISDAMYETRASWLATSILGLSKQSLALEFAMFPSVL